MFCGERYAVCHALSRKKGGFVPQRHDGVRNLLTSLIGKVCTNVENEPQLQSLDNERFNLRSAVTSPEARLDMSQLIPLAEKHNTFLSTCAVLSMADSFVPDAPPTIGMTLTFEA